MSARRLASRSSPSSVRRPSRRAFTLRDLLVVLFTLALSSAAVTVAERRAREASNRIRCSSNLRQVGQAIMIYANENRGGGFPRLHFDTANAAPVPTEYTGANARNPFGPGAPGPHDVTGSLFLLLRTGDILPDAFVCPTSDGERLEGDVTTMSNFPSRANLSYGYVNPYPGAAARAAGFKVNATLTSEFAVAADMGRGPDAALVPANAPRPRMMRANSPWHGGDGQNVLYGDGHVDWAATIFCGSARPIVGAPKDNIYAFGVDATVTTPSAGIRGAPQDPFDSVVLPTADMGPQPSPLPVPGQARREQQYLLVAVGVVVVIGMVIALVVILLKARRRDGQLPPPPPGTPGTPPPLPPLPAG